MDEQKNDKDVNGINLTTDDNQNRNESSKTENEAYPEYRPLRKMPRDDGPERPELEPLTTEGKKIDQFESELPSLPKRTKRNIMKNIVVLSFAFVCLIASMQAMIVLQSSLNPTVGVFGLCANSIFVVLSCLFLSTFLVQKIGCKWSIVFGMCCAVAWMAANFDGNWGSIIPCSAIMGIGVAPLWTGQCTYMTVLGVEYSEITNQMPDDVMSKFFGLFFMAVMTGPIWGNMISGAVLAMDKRQKAAAALAANMTLSTSNDTDLYDNHTELAWKCGKDFCPHDYMHSEESFDPSVYPALKWIYALIGIYIGIAVLGILSVVIFMDDERPAIREKTEFSFKLLAATGRQLKNRYQLMLIPITIYIGMEQGFMVSEFTMAYITCTMGVAFVGLIVITFSAAGAVVSLVSGQIVQKTGRMPLFGFSAIAHFSMLIGIGLVWTPNIDEKWVFFVGAVVWALGDGIIQSQTNALYGAFFHDTSEAAFSNYRMWESIGFIITFAYSSFTCVTVKLYILIVVLILGYAFYFMAEILRKRELADLEKIADLERRFSMKESADVEEEDSMNPMRIYANIARRKSSIFVPDTAVQKAEALIRRKSKTEDPPTQVNQQGQAANIMRRKISKLAPASQPLENIIEGT